MGREKISLNSKQHRPGNVAGAVFFVWLVAIWGVVDLSRAMESKACTKCKVVRALEEFNKRTASKDGRENCCRSCQNHLMRLHQQRPDVRTRKAAYSADYRQRPEAKAKVTARMWQYNRTPQRRLANRVRQAFRRLLNRGASKSCSSLKLLGCTIEQFRQHIESHFSDNMSWEKFGLHGLHIDHIRPLASFDLTDPAQVAAACHYTNLRPLWAKDNLSKGAKWTPAADTAMA